MANMNNEGKRYMTEEERARAKAYEEYLSLREHRSSRDNRDNRGRNIKDDTLYGEYVASSGSRRSGSGSRESGGYQRPAGAARRSEEPSYSTSGRDAKVRRKDPVAESGSRNKADKVTRKDKKAAAASGGGYGGSGGNGGSGGRNGKKKRRKKKGRGLRAAVIIVGVVVLLLGGVIAAGLTVVKNTLDNVGRVELDEDLIGIDPRVDEQLSNYRNIALLGIDARNMSNDQNCRSDSMIVVSINKETNEIKMFSVYRDTLLDIGDGTPGLDKVTHAYYYGGPAKALYALNHNLDLNIKEVMVVNWKAVADAVDALGGLEIEIQQSEIQQMNKYIIDTANHIGGSKKQIEAPGKQTLNGVQAVTYARIRKDAATGDYRRNERMKIVVKAAFEKAKTMDYSQLKKITKEVLPEIKTNMSSADMLGMMFKINSYDMTSSTVGWPYTVKGWSSGGWYGPPVTLTSNVVKLHEEFFNQENYEPTAHVQEISSRISAKTGYY